MFCYFWYWSYNGPSPALLVLEYFFLFNVTVCAVLKHVCPSPHTGRHIRDGKNNNLVGRTGDVRKYSLICLLVTCVGTTRLLTWWNSNWMPYIINLRGLLLFVVFLFFFSQGRSSVIF